MRRNIHFQKNTRRKITTAISQYIKVMKKYFYKIHSIIAINKKFNKFYYLKDLIVHHNGLISSASIGFHILNTYEISLHSSTIRKHRTFLG